MSLSIYFKWQLLAGRMEVNGEIKWVCGEEYGLYVVLREWE